MSKKVIICFEGVEASGKSLHLKNAASFLKKKKIPFIKLREPGGTKNSEKIRKLILNKKSKFNYKTDLFLILASRSENFDKILKQNYKKKIILIDRFVDSTMAYQHYGMGINKKMIILTFPIYWMFNTSISPVNELKTYPPLLYPNRPQFDVFLKIFG